MAEFLIKARDQVDKAKDEEKRNRGWTKGDIVVVMPDGHWWGREERPPKFFVLKIPNLPVNEAVKYIEPHQVDTGLVSMDNTKIIRYVSRRKFRVLIDQFPDYIKNKITDDGIVTVSWDQAKSYIQNKQEQVTE